MAYTEINTNLVINKMTKAKYNELLTLGQIVDTELYYIIDDNDLFYFKSETYNRQEIEALIADLVNAAPSTLDTLGELAAALQENQTVVEVLDTAITNKQDKLIFADALPEDTTGIAVGTIYLIPSA